MVQLGGILALCAGVLFMRSFPMALLLALSAALVLNFSQKTRGHLPTVNAAFLLLLTAGYIASIPLPVQNLPLQEVSRVCGSVAEDPTSREGGYSVLVEVTGSAKPPPLSPWEEARGRVLLSIDGFPDPRPYKGDTAYFRSNLRAPQGFINPGAEWYEEYLWRKRVFRRAFASFPGEVFFSPPLEGGSFLLALRNCLTEAIVNSTGNETGGVLAAITTGDKSRLSPQVKELFRNSGTGHLLAVSALHLGIVAFAVRAIFFFIWVRFPGLALRIPAGVAAPIATLPFILGYLALTGFHTSTMRAAVMISLLLLANLISRRVSYPALLASAVLILAILSPMVLLSPSLHLSVAAILGLFWVLPAFNRKKEVPETPFPLVESTLALLFGRGLKWFVRLAKVSVAASIATFPISAYHFGEVSYLGVFVNPIAVPVICFFSLPLSLAGASIYPLWESGAVFFWKLAGGGAAFVIYFERLLEGWGISKIASAGNISLLAGQMLAVFLIPYIAGVRRIKRLLLTILLSAGMIAWGIFGESILINFSDEASLYALDVGRGQSVLLQLPSEGFAPPFWVLVDGGGIPATDFDLGELVVSPALDALGCKALEIVVSTHPHPDHLLGLTSVVKNFRPKRLFLPQLFKGDQRYEALLVAAHKAGTSVEWRAPNEVVENYNWGTMKTFGGEGPGENDSSLAVFFEVGESRVLIPGDLEIPGQSSLLRRGLVTPVDIMVAPHHGSADAVEPGFFKRLSPGLIISSSGAGTGLPSEALRRVSESAGSRLVTTAESGAVKVEICRGEVYFSASSR